jgi:hypothetical protein
VQISNFIYLIFKSSNTVVSINYRYSLRGSYSGYKEETPALTQSIRHRHRVNMQQAYYIVAEVVPGSYENCLCISQDLQNWNSYNPVKTVRTGVNLPTYSPLVPLEGKRTVEVD